MDRMLISESLLVVEGWRKAPEAMVARFEVRGS